MGAHRTSITKNFSLVDDWKSYAGARDMIQKASLRGDDVPDAPLELTIVEIGLAKRLARSFGLLILLLIITAVTALIPILHFVIVPVMLILTFIVIASSLRKSKIIESGVGACPYCKAPFRVFTRRLRLPFSDVCETCHRQVIVTSDGSNDC